MRRRLLRWLVLVLVGLAYLGGATVQALPPSGMVESVKAGNPMPGCTEMGMTHDAGAPATPHKGITPDCVKLTQCLGIPDLPVQARLDPAPVTYAAVAYWSPDRRLSGLSPTPAPFPPKSA